MIRVPPANHFSFTEKERRNKQRDGGFFYVRTLKYESSNDSLLLGRSMRDDSLVEGKNAIIPEHSGLHVSRTSACRIPESIEPGNQ